MMSTLAGAALCAAVYVAAGQVPTIAPIAARDVVTVKPGTPDHDDDGVDCVPNRIIKHPTGAIYGEEDCPDGSKRHTRLK